MFKTKFAIKFKTEEQKPYMQKHHFCYNQCESLDSKKLENHKKGEKKKDRF